MILIYLQQNFRKNPMSLHSCKSHIEARQSTSESKEWPQYKPQEHSSMKIKEKVHVNEIKKENLFNNWRTVLRYLS